MRVIQVTDPTVQEPSFSTFQGAITYVPRRSHRSDADTPILAGMLVRDAWWTDEQVVFDLSEEKSLRIYLDHEIPEWSISRASAPRITMPILARMSKAVVIQLGRQAQWEWDRASIMRPRIGDRLTRILARDVWLFLYFERSGILLFTSFLRVPERKPLLSWSETD